MYIYGGIYAVKHYSKLVVSFPLEITNPNDGTLNVPKNGMLDMSMLTAD